MKIIKRENGEWYASWSVRSFHGAWINMGAKGNNPIETIWRLVSGVWGERNRQKPVAFSDTALFIMNHLRSGAVLHQLAKGNYKLFVPREDMAYYPAKETVRALLRRNVLIQEGHEILLAMEYQIID